MKVAIDISQVVHEGSGVADYTSNLVKYLSQKKEIDILIFGYSYGKYQKLLEFCESLKLLNPKIEAKLFKVPERLVNIIWNKLHIIPVEKLIGNIDIVHTSDWIEPPSKAKKVTTIHDLIIYKYSETSHPYIIKTQNQKYGWVRKESDCVMADSHATKDDIVKILQMPESKIKVVYPGVDDIYTKKGNHIVLGVKKKYGIKGDYVLSVGTNEPRKNIKSAIDAFMLFKKNPLIEVRKPSVELVIAGKYGWGSVMSYKPDAVRSLGFVEKKDLPALYSGAMLLVYPSLYEGFGLPVIEAMKCGCPVILSDRGSLGEIGQDAGILVDPYDVREIARNMVTLTLNKKIREEWIEKGIKNTSKFTWEKSTDQIISIYKNLLNEKN